MTDQRGNQPSDFRSRLFHFLEEDPPVTTDELKAELENSGIDPEAEVAWVREYVSDQLATMSRKQIRAASDDRQSLLQRLAAFKEKGSAVVAQMIERLESGGEVQLDAFQAAYSKLENPTEDDLRSMLEDWVELSQWDNESEND